MMRKSFSVLTLILALTCSAYAGEMQNGVTDDPQCGVTCTPPPPSAPAVQEPTTDGETPNTLTTTIIEVVLNLLALP